MSKAGIFKTFSLLLALCLVLTVVIIKPVTADAGKKLPVTSDFLPIAMDDWSHSDPSTDFQRLGSFPARYYFGRNNDVRDKIYPRISEAGEGADETYALKLGGAYGPVEAPGGATGKNGYRVEFRFDTPGTVKANTDYTISVKLKKTQGVLNTFSFGINEIGTVHYSLFLTDSDFTGEWQEYVFQYTTDFGKTNAASARAFIAMAYTAPGGGGTVLIDDIKIYETADNAAVNIFKDGSFDVACRQSPVTETPESESRYIPVTVTDYTDIAYDPKGGEIDWFPRFYENTSFRNETRPRISREGEGVNSSHALVIGGAYGPLDNYNLTFRFPGKGTLVTDTAYTISIKLKKIQGTVSSFKLGIMEQWDTHYSLELTSEFIYDAWAMYEWKYTTSGQCDGAWNAVILSLTTPEGGGTLLIDDITVCRADDAGKDNLLKDGTMDTPCRRTEVKETVVSGKTAPMKITDYSSLSAAEAPLSALPRFYYNDDYRVETRPVSSADGVNGTYALKLGGAYGPIKDYSIELRFPSVGFLKSNTEYIISVKLKKTQGTVSKLQMGFKEAAVRYSVMLSDEYISDRWYEYTWHCKTSDGCEEVWNSVAVAFSAPEGGGTLLLDDLTVSLADAPETNLYSAGSFDYRDLGQDEVKWNRNPPSDVEAVFSPASNRDDSGNGVTAQIGSCDAASGNYCLMLGFDSEKATDSTVDLTLHSTRSGGTYKIGFYVRVTGEVDTAYIGVTDGLYRFFPCMNGYSFNQYEYGKWQYVEYIYKDDTSFETNLSYRRFTVKLCAPAGSGIMVDKITVTDVKYSDCPNLMYFGDFEKSLVLPDVSWDDDRFIYKKGER